MRVDLVLLPQWIDDEQLIDRNVAVFDVLRATTSMTAALAAGVSEIRVYPTIDAAARAAGPASPQRLLCGEANCLPPPGFDLGNSPGAFTPEHRGRVIYMSTTNGTRAIVACRRAKAVYPAALVNAGTVARILARGGRDVTLLCAGTGGAVAMEDVLGAGAVLAAIEEAGVRPIFTSDEPLMALMTFREARDNLRDALAASRGGQNVIAAGLAADIDYAARLNAQNVVGVIEDPGANPPVVKLHSD